MTERPPNWRNDDEPSGTVHRAQDRQCLQCRHLDPGGVMAITCAAFPDGIPTPILIGQFDHRNAWEAQDGWPSDGGLRFEQKQGGY